MSARKCKVCGRGNDDFAGWCDQCWKSWFHASHNLMSDAAEWGAKRRAAAQKAGGK